VGKPEGRKILGTPRHRWKNNIKMDLSRSGMGSVDWIDLAPNNDIWQGFVNEVMNHLVP
jgi:hypothetical protein